MTIRIHSGFPAIKPLALPSKDKRLFLFGDNDMELFVNGVTETGPPCSIAELVARKGLTPGALVVELNQHIIKQERWPIIQLKAGDRLELLSFVGGG